MDFGFIHNVMIAYTVSFGILYANSISFFFYQWLELNVLEKAMKSCAAEKAHLLLI